MERGHAFNTLQLDDEVATAAANLEQQSTSTIQP
jgi:hypothetical protein